MKILISCIAFSFFLYIAIYYKVNASKLILYASENVGMTKKGFKDLNSFLLKNGAIYHFGKWMHPGIFIIITFLITLICFMIGIYYGISGALFAAIIGCGLPVFLWDYLNKKDNIYMLEDLHLIYGALSLQIRAATFLASDTSKIITESARKSHFRCFANSIDGITGTITWGRHSIYSNRIVHIKTTQ